MLGSEARPWQSAASPSSKASQASGVSEACTHAGSVSSTGLHAQVTSLLIDPSSPNAMQYWSPDLTACISAEVKIGTT